MNPYREPASTEAEFEPATIAKGETLDAIAVMYGVSRLLGESDEDFRERIYQTMQVGRALTRVERGESLIPPVLVERVELVQRKAELVAELHSIELMLAALDILDKQQEQGKK